MIDTKKLIPHSAKANQVSDKSVENVSITASKLIDVNTILKGSLLLLSLIHISEPTRPY